MSQGCLLLRALFPYLHSPSWGWQGLKRKFSCGRGVSCLNSTVKRNMDSSSASHLALTTGVPLEDTKAVVALKEHPCQTQSNGKKNIAGTFEPLDIDPAHFESQLRHFRKHGYAADPLHPHRITGLVPQHEEEGRGGSGDQAKLIKAVRMGKGPRNQKSRMSPARTGWDPGAKTEEHDCPLRPNLPRTRCPLAQACCELPVSKYR